MRQSTEVDSRAARRLVLDSGHTLVRQSTEFMLHFTNFSVKVNLRSTEAVWTSSHGFLREGEPRILCWLTRYSLSLQILIQSNLRSLFWVEILVSKVALLILCAIVVRMRATPEPARAPTLALTSISTMAPTVAPRHSSLTFDRSRRPCLTRKQQSNLYLWSDSGAGQTSGEIPESLRERFPSKQRSIYLGSDSRTGDLCVRWE